MYKSDLRKINKLQKKEYGKHFTAWLGVRIMYPCRETCLPVDYCLRRVWRYQRGNHNPYIEEEQTKQWLKETLQKDKQRSTKHTHKTKDRVTRTH